MKHKESVSQTYIERDRIVLPDLIRRAKHIATYPTTMKKLYHIAAELPTDKFYISDDAAYDYIRKRLFHHITPTFISPFKQRLFEALYEEVTKMLQYEKYQQMGWKSTTILALGRPAPCVGLTPYIIGLRLRKLHRHNNHKKDD